MKSAILTESKKPLVVAEIDLPEKLDAGQVQVKLHYSGICGAQIDDALDLIRSGEAGRIILEMNWQKFIEII